MFRSTITDFACARRHYLRVVEMCACMVDVCTPRYVGKRCACKVCDMFSLVSLACIHILVRVW